MKIKYLIVLSFVGLSFAAVGQENYFYINWDVNVPLSNTEWISNTSARGAKIGYRMFIDDPEYRMFKYGSLSY